MVVLFPLSQLTSLHVCTHKRKGAFLLVFGADGLKTFVQSLLLTHLKNIRIESYHMQYFHPEKGRRGRSAVWAVGIVRVGLFCIFCKTVILTVPYS